MKPRTALPVALTLALATALVSGCGTHGDAQLAPTVSMVAPTARPAQQASDYAGLRARPGPDGVSVIVGDPAARHTVTVYEDPRSAYSARFERVEGAGLARLATHGDTRVRYVFAAFMDQKVGGTGSAHAANALRASLEAGHFPEFHAALFASQPTETVDGFTDTFLLTVADTVEDLRGKDFDHAVRHHTYADWARDTQEAFTKSGVAAAPSVTVTSGGRTSAPLPASTLYDRTAFKNALTRA